MHESASSPSLGTPPTGSAARRAPSAPLDIDSDALRGASATARKASSCHRGALDIDNIGLGVICRALSGLAEASRRVRRVCRRLRRVCRRVRRAQESIPRLLMRRWRPREETRRRRAAS